ncbi:Flp pilus assembly protein, protease CpaA [Hartmannibacter diazotrophicus]|uniref:Flp pilus assembly protein, protease CpaA n=1 Tax=Hartmannibacter diazotrophicus TaxID=1482074 RepID=A0A2C9D215_9HYPH|nr:prepilin peptidase [Hartmannibacter diazotrophicus]SON54417.1 Flp pilus assembly protein, protease CpaA [Hartmannibacter diazotrophicus]
MIVMLALAVLIFPLTMMAAAVSDLRSMMISNRLSLAVAGSYLVLAPLAGFTWETIGLSVALAALVLVMTFAMFALGWIGGGDAKLVTATMLWMGPQHAAQFAFAMAIAGGLLTLLILLYRRLPLPIVAADQNWLVRLHGVETGIPYGVAIAAGGLLTLPQTHWFEILSVLMP